MGAERDRANLTPASRPRVATAPPANPVLRLQQGMGNQAVGAMLARDAKGKTGAKQVAAPKKPRAPYLEIEKVGLIELADAGIDFTRTRTTGERAGGGGWRVRTTGRIAPSTVSFTLPSGSEQSRVLTRLMHEQVEKGDRPLVAALGLPSLYGHEATEVKVGAVHVTSMSTAKGGGAAIRWELALDDVTMPDWWYEPKVTDEKDEDVGRLGKLGIPAR